MVEVSEKSFNDILAHHGILGQKWGKRNGPPYPLETSDMSKAEKAAQKSSKYVERIKKKTRRDDESKMRNPNRLAVTENASDRLARRIYEKSRRSDERWKNAGRTDRIENRTYDEAKGLANIREGSGRRTFLGGYLGGILGSLAGSSRGIRVDAYVATLDRDERKNLLTTMAGFKDPGRALAVANCYAKIDRGAQGLTAAERDRYFNTILKQLE